MGSPQSGQKPKSGEIRSGTGFRHQPIIELFSAYEATVASGNKTIMQAPCSFSTGSAWLTNAMPTPSHRAVTKTTIIMVRMRRGIVPSLRSGASGRTSRRITTSTHGPPRRPYPGPLDTIAQHGPSGDGLPGRRLDHHRQVLMNTENQSRAMRNVAIPD